MIRRLCATLVMAFLCTAFARGAQAADPAGIRLVDQSGTSFSLRDLAGAPAIVTFVATRCTDTCPIADALFARLANDLAHKRLRAHLVTVTLDPYYDTPFVMTRHARDLGADVRRWRVASGKPRDVDALLDAFGVTRAHAHAHADEAPDVHSTFAYVFDARGRLIRTLPLSTNAEAEILAISGRAG